MNTNKTLDNMLWVFIPKVAQIIANRKGITLDQVNKFIYNSHLYKMLENPETKMWYYSDEDLADFFINEYDGKELFGV